MEVHLKFADEEGGSDSRIDHVDCVMSLYRWLIVDPELRGIADVTAAPHEIQGEMGGALDVISVALGNTIAVANLLVAVAAWRGSRPNPPRVQLERNGRTVTVQGDSPEALAEVLRAFSDDGGSGSNRATPDGDEA